MLLARGGNRARVLIWRDVVLVEKPTTSELATSLVVDSASWEDLLAEIDPARTMVYSGLFANAGNRFRDSKKKHGSNPRSGIALSI